MASKPTQRTLEYLRDQGITAQVVERWLPHCKRRLDLFGCIDLVALPCVLSTQLLARPIILGIQTTSGDNHAKRAIKALAEPRLRLWLEAGGRFEIWSWSKKVAGTNKDGKRSKVKTWQLRREELTLDDFAEAAGNGGKGGGE